MAGIGSGAPIGPSLGQALLHSLPEFGLDDGRMLA
jgi:hypothetical protein